MAYFQDVEKAIAGQRGWEVRRDEIVLWCFSFTKLLMYRDLDPENWPADKRLEDRPLIRALLQDGFPPVEPLCKPNDNIGIGDMCLELHSKMSNKKVVLQEVGRTLKLGSPAPSAELPDVIKRLKDRQATLNSYANIMHTPFGNSGQTPYQILSELIDLRAAATPLPDFQLPDICSSRSLAACHV